VISATSGYPLSIWPESGGNVPVNRPSGRFGAERQLVDSANSHTRPKPVRRVSPKPPMLNYSSPAFHFYKAAVRDFRQFGHQETVAFDARMSASD